MRILKGKYKDCEVIKVLEETETKFKLWVWYCEGMSTEVWVDRSLVDTNQETPNLRPIERVKKGEYFKLNGKTVYVADGYNRSTKKYSAFRFDDVNHFIEKKKGTRVEVEFDF